MTVSKEQFDEDLRLLAIATDKNEKLAWVRKRKKIKELIDTIKPIEDSILQLIGQKQPIIDEIVELRAIMVKDCIHPEDSLIHHGSYIHCKFCDKNIRFNRTLIDTDTNSDTDE